jgi:hypothetical protein
MIWSGRSPGPARFGAFVGLRLASDYREWNVAQVKEPTAVKRQALAPGCRILHLSFGMPARRCAERERERGEQYPDFKSLHV